MALINLPNGRWIDIPAPKYGIDYGVESNKVIERNITPERVIEILRGVDYELDDAIIYNGKEWGGEKEKLIEFANFLQNIKLPKVLDPNIKEILKNAKIEIYDIGNEIIEKAEVL